MTLEHLCIISDLHSNYEALKTVMTQAEKELQDKSLTDRITALKLRRDTVDHEYRKLNSELTRLETNKEKYQTTLDNLEESTVNQKRLSSIRGILKRSATKKETKRRLKKEQRQLEQREKEIKVRYEQLVQAKLLLDLDSIKKEATSKEKELRTLEQQLAEEKLKLPKEMKYISLGDNIGYGSDPIRVLDTLIDLKEQGRLVAALIGNHEQYLLSLVDSTTYEEYKARRQMMKEGAAFIGEGFQKINRKAGNAILFTYDRLFGQPEIIEVDLSEAIKNALKEELKKYKVTAFEELEDFKIIIPKEPVNTGNLRDTLLKKTYNPHTDEEKDQTLGEYVNAQLTSIIAKIKERDQKAKEATEQLEKLKKSLEDGSLIEKAIKKAQEEAGKQQEEAYQRHTNRIKENKYYKFLKELTYTHEINGTLFVHSHPLQPEKMGYVWKEKAVEAIAALPAHIRAVVLGHNHTQFESEHQGKKVYSVGALGEHRRNSNAPRYAMMKNGQITFPQPPEYNWQKEEQQQIANGLIIPDEQRKAGQHWIYSGKITLTEEQVSKGEFQTSFKWQPQ